MQDAGGGGLCRPAGAGKQPAAGRSQPRPGNAAGDGLSFTHSFTHQLDVTVARKQQVLGLQVAVDDVAIV